MLLRRVIWMQDTSIKWGHGYFLGAHFLRHHTLRGPKRVTPLPRNFKLLVEYFLKVII